MDLLPPSHQRFGHLQYLNVHLQGDFPCFSFAWRVDAFVEPSSALTKFEISSWSDFALALHQQNNQSMLSLIHHSSLIKIITMLYMTSGAFSWLFHCCLQMPFYFFLSLMMFSTSFDCPFWLLKPTSLGFQCFCISFSIVINLWWR